MSGDHEREQGPTPEALRGISSGISAIWREQIDQRKAIHGISQTQRDQGRGLDNLKTAVDEVSGHLGTLARQQSETHATLSAHIQREELLFAGRPPLESLGDLDERTDGGQHVKVPIEEEQRRRHEIHDLRAEVEQLRRRADDSAAHNLRAIELAAEAKGISEGKRVDSFPPLVRPLIVIVGKVGSHIAKDGLKHGLTIVGTLLAAYLAHHFGWLGWLLK